MPNSPKPIELLWKHEDESDEAEAIGPVVVLRGSELSTTTSRGAEDCPPPWARDPGGVMDDLDDLMTASLLETERRSRLEFEELALVLEHELAWLDELECRFGGARERDALQRGGQSCG